MARTRIYETPVKGVTVGERERMRVLDTAGFEMEGKRTEERKPDWVEFVKICPGPTLLPRRGETSGWEM